VLCCRVAVCVVLTALALSAEMAQAQSGSLKANKNLKIIILGVEGPVATLAPSQPVSSSSADRIAAATDFLGMTEVDYLLMTHHPADHVSGLEALLAKRPVETFIDHGPNRDHPPTNASPRLLCFAPAMLYPNWVAAHQGHPHITARIGQTLDIGSTRLESLREEGSQSPRDAISSA
jgi:competence protein ComEC